MGRWWGRGEPVWKNESLKRVKKQAKESSQRRNNPSMAYGSTLNIIYVFTIMQTLNMNIIQFCISVLAGEEIYVLGGRKVLSCIESSNTLFLKSFRSYF